MELQISGRLDRAEQIYRAVLQADPRHAVANHCIGMLNVQQRRAVAGLPHLLAALETKPEIPDYWLGYLEALLLLGRIDEANATLALGVRHGLAGAAVDAFATRLEAKSAARPERPAVGKQERAARRRQLRLGRRDEALLMALLQQGKFAEARSQAETMTKRFPENGMGWKALGAFLCAEGRLTEALDVLRTSVRLRPHDPEAFSNLGIALVKLELFDEAESSLQAALKLDPNLAATHFRLGMKFALQGQFPDAVESLRRAIALGGDGSTEDEKLGYSNLLFSLCHLPDVDADALFAEHCRAGARFERDLRHPWPQHLNTREPDRCLRIGLVSGDFREHAVSFFLEPVLRQLSGRRTLDLTAYYNHTIEDAVTNRMRGYMNEWRPVYALSDSQLVQRILDDRIDILVDLSGHTGYSRISAFAYKPAPVQVSWLGYVGTTGLRAMDYYMTDRHYLPPEPFARQFTEKLVFLPAMAPFTPVESAPPVNGLPALRTGVITFGSFNRIGKLNAVTIESWCKLLLALPEARMIIVAVPPGARRDELIGQFTSRGIVRERLVLHERCSMDAYLALHHQIDICLDTRPWSGGTTTNHALWMGVPTLTIVGTTPASRISAALLGQVGLQAFVAANDEDLVEKGVYWANHLAEFAQLRVSLRERCEQSPIRRADLIAAAVENALRSMWKRWCAALPAQSFDANALHGTDRNHR